MKEAGWALRAGTEAEIAEERRRAKAQRRVGWTLAMASLGLCPLSCAGLLSHVFDQTSLAWVALPLLYLTGLAMEYLRRLVRTDDYARERQATLWSEYKELGGWLVEVCVRQGAAPTGYDRGVLWFEGDRLLFLGERTSFALSADRVRHDVREHWAVRGLLPTLSIHLDCRTAGGSLSLGIDVVSQGASARGVDSLRRTLGGWLGARRKAESQWPPLALGPGSPDARALRARAFALTALWAAIVALVALVAVAASPVGVVVSIGVLLGSLGMPGLWTLRLRWRAWHDRLRLEVDA